MTSSRREKAAPVGQEAALGVTNQPLNTTAILPPQPAIFTLWTAPTSCAKGYDLAPNGELIKVPARIFARADARRCVAETLSDFAELVGKLKPGHFITSGTSNEESGEQLQTRRLEKNYPFSSAPGVLILDGDGLENFSIHTAKDYVDALRNLDPALKDVGFVVAPSASSYVTWPNGAHGLRGLHAFCFIDNASLIPAVLTAMHMRFVAAGMGRGKVAARGNVLIRSLVDCAMKTSNQPCFEGGIRSLNDRVTQTRAIEIFEGRMLCAAQFPVASTHEVIAAVNAERLIVRQLKTEAKAQGLVWQEARVKAMLIKGVPGREAVSLVLKMQKTKSTDLPPEWPLYLDDGRCVSVQEVLSNRTAFDGVTCADPLEPEEGPCKAKIFCGPEQKKPLIHTMVHGSDSCYFLLGIIGDEISLTHLTASPEDEESYIEQALEEDFNDNSKLTLTSPASPVLTIARGKLIYEDEKGTMHKIISSQARNLVLPYLKPFYAWSATAQTWHNWASTHWAVAETSEKFDKALHDLVAVGCSHLGFTAAYPRDIKALIQLGASLPLPTPPEGLVLPFENGLLDLKTKTLIPVHQKNALTWALPHRFDATADCPNVKAWLKQVVGDDLEMVEYLRAWLAAILTGRSDLQRFLYLKGPGGSGKSTFIRLASMLVGVANSYTTDLKNLETNRFETAALYGRRLVVITDAGKYGGSVDVLKALTGQDPMRIERKNVQQQAGTFIFQGIVLFASNEQLSTTDLTSGLDRRRAVVSFNRIVLEAEKAAWEALGGEKEVLHEELPGLVNWLLALPKEEVTRIISAPPTQAEASNHEAMLANNSVARWLTECCVPEKGIYTIVGVKKEVVEGGQREIALASEHLYPNFIVFTQGENIQTLGRRRFKETLIDTARTMGVSLDNKRKPHHGADAYLGLRLKTQTEPLYPWLNPSVAGTQKTPVKVVV